MSATVRDENGPQRGLGWMVAALVLAGGAAPLVLYGLWAGRVATVTPQQAKQRLLAPGQRAALVDVRPAHVFAAGHIDGAVNWPLEEVLAAAAADALPPPLRGKTLLLVCDVGLSSRRAAGHLAAVGVEQALGVRGGIQEWIRSTAEALGRPAPGAEKIGPEVLFLAAPPHGEAFDRWRIGPDRVIEFPFRQSPVFQQAAAVLAFFVFKPIYTILSLLAVVALWQSRTADLVALRWGMIAFFLGENACAVNYLFFHETSYLAEYFHSLGMLLCFSFVAYAVLEGVDRRLLMLSDAGRRCAAMGLCGGCAKYADVPCRFRRMFYVLLPALIVLALMLPTADWRDNCYNTWIFGQLYNYAHLRIYQQLENWYCAAAAVLMLAVSLAILACKRENALPLAKAACAAGIGPLGFGLLRMILGAAYDDNRVWYLFWEETTELLFVVAICFILWTFRRGLALDAAGRKESPEDSCLGP